MRGVVKLEVSCNTANAPTAINAKPARAGVQMRQARKMRRDRRERERERGREREPEPDDPEPDEPEPDEPGPDGERRSGDSAMMRDQLRR